MEAALGRLTRKFAALSLPALSLAAVGLTDVLNSSAKPAYDFFSPTALAENSGSQRCPGQQALSAAV